MEYIITDAAIVVEIFNDHKLSTRQLAKKYSTVLGAQVTTSTIAQVKNKRGPYAEIIQDYQDKMTRFWFRRKYGYDPIKKYTPPPWGKPQSLPQQFKKKSA